MNVFVGAMVGSVHLLILGACLHILLLTALDVIFLPDRHQLCSLFKGSSVVILSFWLSHIEEQEPVQRPLWAIKIPKEFYAEAMLQSAVDLEVWY